MVIYEPRLEGGKKRLWRDTNNDELCCLSMRRIVGAAVGSLGFVRRFRACTYNSGGIVVNYYVVGDNSCGFNKFCALACCVRFHWPNETYEVVCSSCFVIRDLEEERRHDLPNLCEVGVGRVAVHQLKLFKRIGEFCHDIFGRHGVWSAWIRERFVHLQLQVT